MDVPKYAHGFATDLLAEVCAPLAKRKGAEAARDLAWAEASVAAVVNVIARGRIDQARATLELVIASAIEYGFEAKDQKELAGILGGHLWAACAEVEPGHPLASGCAELMASDLGGDGPEPPSAGELEGDQDELDSDATGGDSDPGEAEGAKPAKGGRKTKRAGAGS